MEGAWTGKEGAWKSQKCSACPRSTQRWRSSPRSGKRLSQKHTVEYFMAFAINCSHHVLREAAPVAWVPSRAA